MLRDDCQKKKKSGRDVSWLAGKGDGAKLVRRGAERAAHHRGQVQLLLGDPHGGPEAEVLQQRDEEDKELHAGQALSQANPATCSAASRGPCRPLMVCF